MATLSKRQAQDAFQNFCNPGIRAAVMFTRDMDPYRDNRALSHIHDVFNNANAPAPR